MYALPPLTYNALSIHFPPTATALVGSKIRRFVQRLDFSSIRSSNKGKEERKYAHGEPQRRANASPVTSTS